MYLADVDLFLMISHKRGIAKLVEIPAPSCNGLLNGKEKIRKNKVQNDVTANGLVLNIESLSANENR